MLQNQATYLLLYCKNIYPLRPGTATNESYPGSEPEKLYNLFDRIAVV